MFSSIIILRNLIKDPPFISILLNVIRAFLATYYVRYSHVMSFLRNIIPYYLLNHSKPHAVIPNTMDLEKLVKRS